MEKEPDRRSGKTRESGGEHARSPSYFSTPESVETLVNSVEGIVWEADAQTFEFTFVSQQAERLLGYPVQEWIETPGFWQEHVEDPDVVHFSIGNVDEGWNGTLQVEQCMEFDRSFGSAKPCPWEQFEAQVDCGCVQRIDRRIQIQSQVGIGVERACDGDQALSEIGIDAPVAPFVGIGQGRAFHRPAEPGVVKLGALRRQAHFDVAQAFAKGQLCKDHGKELVPARQLPNAAIAVVALNAPAELVVRKESNDLRKDCLPSVHRHPSHLMMAREYGSKGQTLNSNRRNPFLVKKTMCSIVYSAAREA